MMLFFPVSFDRSRNNCFYNSSMVFSRRVCHCENLIANRTNNSILNLNYLSRALLLKELFFLSIENHELDLELFFIDRE